MQTFCIKCQPPLPPLLPPPPSLLCWTLKWNSPSAWAVTEWTLPAWIRNCPETQFLTGNMWLSNVWNMAQHTTVKSQLRRSFSEHVKDSTNKAWDVFWRGVRERRLWGELGFNVGEDYLAGKKQFMQGCRSVLVKVFCATQHGEGNWY